MNRLTFITFVIVTILAIGGWYFLSYATVTDTTFLEEWTIKQEQEEHIQKLLEKRLKAGTEGEDADPFGDQDEIKVLFIGLDNRAGQNRGHCDAIQFIEINKKTDTVKITAVPRGTYAPLPPGPHKETDYYVSNSCGIAGIEYGVEQIERIVGKKADYIVLVGFSQALGIFRQLKLPTVETMQWLRHRQGYAIGEPQRARNHSNFIKHLLVKYSPQLESKFSVPAQYLLYKFLRTDLSYKQVSIIADAIIDMDVSENPEQIRLSMRPAHDVQDFEYVPEELDQKLSALLDPISGHIPEGAFTGETEKSSQGRLLNSIEIGLDDPEYISWAFNNFLWVQVEQDATREFVHFNLMREYIALQETEEDKLKIAADYVIEMSDFGKIDWAEKGRQLIKDLEDAAFKKSSEEEKGEAGEEQIMSQEPSIPMSAAFL